MADSTLPIVAALVALVGLMAYAVLGGADFGGGVWDLFATGPRKNAQREAIIHAMGPVWEANHVWLIFVLVVLFTCFPRGYATLATSLFIPFHLALIGIVLRGASFVFRGYGRRDDDSHPPVWSVVFGAASLITPVLLGMAFGAVTAGEATGGGWLSPYSLGCGALALSTCAYLAAVFLSVETRDDLREDFRRRAVVAGTLTAGLAMLVLGLAWTHAPWFVHQFFRPRSWPVLSAGMALFALSAWAVFTRRYKASRMFAVGQVIVLLLGWALAQEPYLVYPNLTLDGTAGPAATVRFMLWSLVGGAALLVPSLWLLFRVFKSADTKGRVGMDKDE